MVQLVVALLVGLVTSVLVFVHGASSVVSVACVPTCYGETLCNGNENNRSSITTSLYFFFFILFFYSSSISRDNLDNERGKMVFRADSSSSSSPSSPSCNTTTRNR